ncbi:S41 family peptidase [Candidatus Uhrbacteria bacterium]|nr:S41 family peptidase [Candidatus Uhrbacteria bacterium]
MTLSDLWNKIFAKPRNWGVGILLAVVFFAVGYIAGQSRGVVRLEDGSVIGIGEAAQRSADVEFDLFWDVWDLLQKEYLRGPVSEKDLFYGALSGLVDGLDDPYSDFFNPEEADEFEHDLEGTFEGIGAEIGIRDEQLVVVAPLKNSPASRAGVQAGDKIYLIDDEETIGMSVDEAVRRIRGPRGTTVTLTLSHDGIEAVEEVEIERDVIEISSVEWELRDDGIAVIRVFFFNEDTARHFNDAVVELLASGPDGIILDLRNNPGGFLDRAVSVAGEWIGNDVVVIERKDDGTMIPTRAQGVARLSSIPTVVLVNAGSASASEIVAGALQDYGYATILGTQTFGKGSVQEYRELPDGSALKLTVSEWLTPKERSIDKNGITPDTIVEFDVERYTKEEVDSQLDAAVDALTL